MKKTKLNIAIASIALSVLTSCDLDRKPFDGLTAKDQFSSQDGFDVALRGVYGGFRKSGYFGDSGHWISSGDVFSDNLTLNHQARKTQIDLFELRNTPVDDEFPLYRTGYEIISRANSILDNINNIPEGEDRNRVQAEALALRALVHFDISRIYCKIPTQSDDAKQSLGIAYIKTFNPLNKHRRKGTTVDGVYQQVIEDLQRALSLIGDEKNVGQLNKTAIEGILSRVYLHYGDYNKAAEFAQKVIDAGVLVTPRDQVSALWKDEYKKSVLFEIRITDKDGIAIGNTYGQANRKGNKPEYVCSNQLFELYSENDIRKTTTISVGDFEGKTYRSVAKYFGRTSGSKNIVDGKYLRAEEVYLTLAEALYRQTGNEAQALSVLDKVREQRYENFVSKNETGQALLNAILLERRLELAFEGDRFFTLKRLALGLNRGNEGEFADGTGTTPKVKTYPANGFRWQLPIPKGAIDAFPELSEDQNPGY